MKIAKPVNTHACQSRHRPECVLHAPPGTDLCKACQRSEERGEHVPRISRPTWDANGQRISYPPTELVKALKARLQRRVRDEEEIPF